MATVYPYQPAAQTWYESGEWRRTYEEEDQMPNTVIMSGHALQAIAVAVRQEDIRANRDYTVSRDNDGHVTAIAITPEEDPERREFKECATCAAKPGSPPLCPSCLHNRALISRLQASQKLTDAQAADLGREITEDLFHNGQGETAVNLKMYADRSYLGGWSYGAVRDCIFAKLQGQPR